MKPTGTRSTSPTSCAEVNPSSPAWWFFHQDEAWACGFTDARLDLGNFASPGDNAVARTPHEQQHYLQETLGPLVDGKRIVYMNQVHGAAVRTAESGEVATADALTVDRSQIAALVRVADCVPIVIGAPGQPLVSVVHAGRKGMAAGVAVNASEELRRRGARSLEAWVGPRACGSCYEVPADMRDEVAAIEPASRSVTRWGTPALDVGAGVIAQLERAGVVVHDIGAQECTIENDRFWSYRRQGQAAGRFGAVAMVKTKDMT